MNRQAAYRQALTGDLTELWQWRGRNETIEDQAWDLVLRALFGLLSPSLASPPHLSEVEALVAESRILGKLLSEVCCHGEMASVLRFDLAELRQWHEIHAAVRDRSQESSVELALLGAQGWIHLMSGEAEKASSLAASLSAEAAAAMTAPLRIEATVQRALAALSRDQLDEAADLSRLGSRMARTEELIIQEYLANIVLARARRHTGRSYLAQRILGALVQVVPSPWQAWISWELVLAGAPEQVVSQQAPAVHALALLEAAQGGDRSTFGAALSALSSSLSGWHVMAEEAQALAAALSPESPLGEPSGVTRAWLEGETGDLPPPVSGLCVPEVSGDGKESPVVFVLCDQRGGRRLLRQGLGLIQPGLSAQAPWDTLAQGRAQAALAALAFAGPTGLTDAELFQAVYGFAYHKSQHDGVFRTLLYRARKQVEGRAEITRVEGRIVLRPGEVLVIPDPRCTPELEDLILRTIAAYGGRASARAAATALSVPLRTVQATLQQLVDDGTCVVERQGRQIEYRVEDTTFFEPTLHRMKPRKAETTPEEGT